MRRAQLLLLVMAIGCGGTPASEMRAPRSGEIGTWMGDGTQGFDGDGKVRLQSWLNQPMDVTFGPDGLAYVVDWNNHRIRRLAPEGKAQTFIGRSLPGDWDCQVPTDPANCNVPLSGVVQGTDLPLNHPMAIKFAPDGTGYLAAWHNHKVEAFDPGTAAVRIVAGQQAPGYVGDGGPASASRLNFVGSVVVDGHGNVYVSDERNRRVRRIAPDATRTIADVAGTDNPPPGGALALGSDGALYLADTANHCIRKVTPGSDGVVGDGDAAEEIISTVAGQCTLAGLSGDGGPATGALLNRPGDIEIGPDGNLYIADTGNHVIRRLDLATGIIDRVAGTGSRAFAGDLGPPLEAAFDSPYGVAFDAAGNLYVTDTLNNRIRVILK